MLRLGVATLAVLALGCGGASEHLDAGSDAGPDAGPPCPPRAHPAFPQVPYHGGSLRKNPELVTITFADYDLAEEVGRFGDWIVGSSWLTTVGFDYGIQTGTHLDKVALAESAPGEVQLSDIAVFLDQKAKAGAIPRPSAGDPNLIYLLYYPASTTVVVKTRAEKVPVSCSLFGGFHSHGVIDGVDVPFGIVFECPEWASLFGLAVGAFTEVSASHEIIEAATNPFSDTSPGYALDPTDPWGAIGGSELGDLCTDSFAPPTPEGFRVQQIWSNSAAQDGGSPCIPTDPAEPYFNVFTSPAGPLQIPAGVSTTVVLEGWSTHPGTSWSVFKATTGDFDPIVSPSLSAATAMSDCTSFQLQIAVPAGTPSGSQVVIQFLSQRLLQPGTLALWSLGVSVP